jgi:hypothetical protein
VPRLPQAWPGRDIQLGVIAPEKLATILAAMKTLTKLGRLESATNQQPGLREATSSLPLAMQNARSRSLESASCTAGRDGAAQRSSIARAGSGKGQPHAAFDDSLSDGVTGKTGDVVDVEFAHEVLAMFVHRFEAQAQFLGD